MERLQILAIGVHNVFEPSLRKLPTRFSIPVVEIFGKYMWSVIFKIAIYITLGLEEIYWYTIFIWIHYVKNVQIRSFFWSVFSCIRSEYGEIRSIPPYSVRMRENTDHKKLRFWTLFTQWQEELLTHAMLKT